MQAKTDNTADEDRFTFKPILGIRPGVYLAAACLAVLLLLLFFILLYPGIAHPGAMVVFTSEPSGAALRVDDVYQGTSPCRVFIPAGAHTMEAVLPGFTHERSEHTIPGRLFASILFPRRYPLTVTLTSGDPAAVLAAAAHDYAAWSFGGEPTAAWQIPLVLSQGVYRTGNVLAKEDVDGILAAASRFAVTRAALRDLVRAQFLAANSGNVLSPLTVTYALEQALSFLDNNPGSAAWLADTLPPDSAAILISSSWYQNQLAAFAGVAAGENLAKENSIPELPASRIRVGGLLFSALSGGVVVQGEPFPHRVPVDALFVCAEEVPASAYADFLDANPQWRADQREELIRQELVDSEYLADYGNMAGINRMNVGVNAVSWFAARAFCEWLSSKLPDSFAGWEIRLPTEAEWEYAAKSNNGTFAANSAWEWCADPYSHYPSLSATLESISAVGSPERSVRGGTWLNTAGAVTAETRASLPPQTCSAFVSFRPVIARRSATHNALDR